ncbi:transferrin-binding protein-like solute binding protein [Pasteurella atlantica]|uniref:Transferrin-binding protein-like solute binding protein n=2 Tax=Pasteurellaceae TaxID=712 RepID=A0ACC6HMU7_9PAST|nr:transferrin-binding protein-like solute binding protein [Pasteurella atlantica]MDP8033442.1 transferrin-binding protein-like solute binding protein [Pasteurella atlantica]MDP8035378.1 transferrin-binding protein-like solute binding protein [Pasteurella atlantica]MDP8037329.1 transferrin-binding protein-like solute binding protein [Pasteurella atlantica]MDP8047677.1 transferrin-binding protein-like solute binding protein [Pasteurella atlantica]MDP8049762.1 transferrin-binding protein-like so
MQKILWVIGVSAVLTACGSGGSSSHSNINSSSNSSPINTTKIAGVLVAKDDTNPIPKKDPDTGREYNDYEFKMKRITNDQDINTIQINTVNVKLLPDGYNKQENYETKRRFLNEKAPGRPEVGKVLQKVVSGLAYKYVRFGINDDYDPYLGKPQKIPHTFGIFVQGYVTNNMPKTGTVTYIGDAYGASREFARGKSNIEVNFGNKTLKGTLSEWQDYDFIAEKTPVMIFNAKITGNQFEGKNVKGNFFGNKAAEIGGVYYDPTRMEGAVFGAKKQ